MKLPKLLVQALAEGRNSRNMRTCNAKCLWCCDLEVTCLEFISLNKEANCVGNVVVVSSVKVDPQVTHSSLYRGVLLVIL